MITRKKYFGSHFYRFYVFQGVIELIEYPVDLIGRRSVSIPELYDLWLLAPSSGVFPTFFQWFYVTLFALRTVVPFYMALYRLSAVTMPTKCEKIWNRAYPYCIVSTFILAFLSTLTMLLGSTLERSITPTGQRVMTFLNNHYVTWVIKKYRVSTGLCTLIGLATITSLISYVSTLWILKYRHRSVRKNHINVKQEYRLTFFMMLLWSTQVYTFVTQSLFFFRDVNNANQQIFITELNYYGIELGIFLNPLFMVFCNKILRTELVLAFIPCLKNRVTDNSSNNTQVHTRHSTVKTTTMVRTT
uniref:Serpentine receptor class gamma n=1 Tax=Panagrellus redivivus TaxID=6233 RepID=A0A7E4VY18_PANRE